ncbi:MAG: hypothetical protein HY071_00930 [Chloroflexi bacterium]|nr:hypothetical protein [Chloroflexota bacterium]
MRASTLFALFCGLGAAVIAASLPASDSDLFWHLQSGDLMIDRGELLRTDPFSYTRFGTPYSVGAWLAEIVYAGVFRALSWTGVDLLRGLLIGIAVFFTARAVLRLQRHPAWAFPPLVLAILVSKPDWGDRPQLFTLALFPIFLDVLLRTRLTGKTRQLWALPFLVLLWANLHGAFVIGIALVLLFAVEAIHARLAIQRPLALVSLLCVVAGLATPAFWRAYYAAGSYATGPSRGGVLEEQPADVLSGGGAAFAILLALALVLALLPKRRDAAVALDAPLLWSLLIVPFTLLGLAIQRQLPFAAFILAPYVAAHLPAAFGRPIARVPRLPRKAALPIALVAVSAAVAAMFAVAPRQADLSAYPVAAEPILRREAGNVLAEYDWGGWLIRYAPSVPTFVDGRGATLFAPDVLADWDDAVALRPPYREILDGYDVRIVLLRPTRPLAIALRESGWKVLGEARDAWVLLERP